MRKTVVTILFLTTFGVAHAGEPAPLSIAVDGPKGASFRLVYKGGNGWEFADHSATKLVSAAQQEGPTGLIETLPTDTLQSVFVDAPTGYVFVYVIDEGWRFVGSVADAKR